MEAISNAGHHMSLAALKQHDPYINKIVDVTGQVALYTFNSKANEWEKTDIEGTLFVYTRSATPYHGFTIMNRLNMKNLVEPINKDLEFQLQDPFLLYRNSNLSIYSIWFYDKNDCQRIAQLMSQVVRREAVRAKQPSPGRNTPCKTNGCAEERPIDILEMLSKAKDEYERTQDVSGSTELFHNREAHTSTTEAEHTPSLSQHEKAVHSGPKQITVEELFGSSLSKDQNLMSFPNQSAVDKGPSDFLRGQSLGQPFSFEPAPGHRVGMEGSEDHLGTAVRAQSNTPTQTHHSSALVPRPDVKSVQNYSVPAGTVFHPPGPAEHVVLPKLGSEGGKVLVMQQAHLKPTSPLLMCQPGSEQLNPPQSSLCGPGAGGSALNMGFIHQDLLHKLQPPPQPERLPQPVLTKPALAPNFLPSHGQLATPECFKEPAAKPVAFTGIPVAPIQSLQQNKEVDVFAPSKSLSKSLPVVPMQAVSAASGGDPSVLLSPSVFQQAAAKAPEPENKPGTTSPLTLGATDTQGPLPPAFFSRTQLQDTLIHLLKNDSKFLGTIHEAYLHVLAKDLNNMKL
ncbi:mRNA-decapping enzyme 1A isoform X2 [Amia ocellicauda]|uniref:mRNA-decapping enzyme 1A isoform X2 n=1 Tax=Amia ocellicauda TaxID=2972642 RepID=UPI003463A77E